MLLITITTGAPSEKLRRWQQQHPHHRNSRAATTNRVRVVVQGLNNNKKTPVIPLSAVVVLLTEEEATVSSKCSAPQFLGAALQWKERRSTGEYAPDLSCRSMAPFPISVFLFLAYMSGTSHARDALADKPLCVTYENRTAQMGVPRGLSVPVMQDVLFLELRDCRLESRLEKFPPHADYVILSNITFGDRILWEEVLPLNITRELVIKESNFKNESILGNLFINNIAVFSISNSNLTAMPKFNVTNDCITKKANFSGNTILIVSEEAFQSLYSSCKLLEDVDLTRNLIKKFPKFVAQNVSKCKLHLEFNPLLCYENDHLATNQRARDMLIRTPHCEKDGELVPFWFHDRPICDECHCYIHSDIYVNCSGRGLASLPADLPRETTHLDVSGNQITSLRVPDKSRQREYQTVKHLNASGNPISRIDDYGPGVCNLMMLDVSSGSLESLPQSLVDKLLNTTGCVPLLSVGRLLLGDNPWRCDCDLLPFKRFIGERAKEIVDFFTVRCGRSGEEVYKVQEETLCPPPFYVLNPWDVAIVVISTLILLIIFKTTRDYRRQKHTGKLPKFFKM